MTCCCAAGINAERLASYDRPIHSAPPTFNPQQIPQLTQDLIAYRCAICRLCLQPGGRQMQLPVPGGPA